MRSSLPAGTQRCWAGAAPPGLGLCSAGGGRAPGSPWHRLHHSPATASGHLGAGTCPRHGHGHGHGLPHLHAGCSKGKFSPKSASVQTSCPDENGHKPPGLCAKETPLAIPTPSHSLLWLMFKHLWPDQPPWGPLLFFTSAFPKAGHSGRANAQHQFFMRITPHPSFCATAQGKHQQEGQP